MPYERLPMEPQVEALIRLFEQAEDHLAVQVVQSVASGKMGSAAYRNAQLQRVRMELQFLKGRADRDVEKLIKDVYGFGVRIAHGNVSIRFGGNLHSGAIDALVKSLQGQLDESIRTVGRRINDLFRREALHQVALQLAEGAARQEASFALAQTLRSRGVTAFVDSRGSQWGLRTYSQMVIRTTTRESLSYGTANGIIQYGGDLVDITSHPHETDICDEYDGKTFSLTGATPGYDVLDVYPPFHPNCAHVMMPSAETLNIREAALQQRGSDLGVELAAA